MFISKKGSNLRRHFPNMKVNTVKKTENTSSKGAEVKQKAVKSNKKENTLSEQV
jgi:hypothetical protein